MGDKCEIRWCKSGEPATVRVTENIGDGAFRVDICQQCATVLDLNVGDDLPDANDVEKALEAHYPKDQPPYTWQPHNRPPDSKPGKWSKEVVAITNLGNLFKLTCIGGYWQRPAAMVEGEKVAWWIYQPF